jgi:glycosyltransferase involved in cell wall biosynthesis
MAAGIPVIHSEVEGLVECVGGAGIQCNRIDIDAWVSAIQRILGDRAYREQLRQQGFERVEQIEILQRQQRFELAESVETINEIAYQVSE